MTNQYRAATAIGRVIRQQRERYGLSLDTVATYAHITKPQLSRLERGLVNCNLDTVDALCEILNINLNRVKGLRSYKKGDDTEC